MAMHKGFSLLEIIIAMLLSAIILTAVMQITFRVTKQDLFAKKHVSKDVHLMMMHMQLLQDISGFCALVYEQAEAGDEKAEKAPAQKQVESSGKKNEKQADDIKKYFYSVNKDNHLDFFTFVTTNSLAFYGQKADPLVRVTYRLIQGKEENSGFSLVRKQTANLKFEESEKSGKPSVILDGIKKFETTYFYVKQKKEEKGEKKVDQKSEKKELPQLGSEKEWGMKKDDEKESQEQKIPHAILIQCECENGLKQDFWYEIPFVFEGIPQLPKLTRSKKAPEKQPAVSQEDGVQDA